MKSQHFLLKLQKNHLLLIAVFLFGPAISLQAANRYWVGSLFSNWNNVLDWSTTSGGVPGASVPGSSDVAIFDNGSSGNCSLDATVNVAGLSVTSGYGGTIAQNGNTILVGGAATFSGGIFSGGTANMTVTGTFTLSGASFTATSAVMEIRGDGVFSSGGFVHNSGTVRFNGSSSQTISGISPTFYILEFVGKGNSYTLSSAGNITVLGTLITSGSLFYNLATGTIDVKGDITINNTATGCGGDAMININGTGTQNFSGGASDGVGALPQLTINKTAGILNLSGFPSVSNNFTYTAGTVSAGTSTFCFTHGNVGSYSTTGSVTLGNVEYYINTSLLTLTIPGTTTLTASGNLTIAGAGSLLLNTGNLNVGGNMILTNTGTGGGGSATINFTGSAVQSIDGTAVTLNQSRLPVLVINKSGGTLSLLGNLSFASNVTYTAGTINAGTSTCYVVNNLTITGNLPVNNLTISAAGNTTVTIGAGSTVTVGGTFDLENGSNYITLNTGTVAVQGNLTDNNTSTAGGGTATLLFNGSGVQTISSTGVMYQGIFPAVTINKPSGTLVLPSVLTTRGNWTYTAGTLDATTNNSTVVFGNTLTITGSHSLNNIAFDAGGNYTVTVAAGTTLTAQGNMAVSGTNNMTINTGTINLLGNLNLTNTGTSGGGSATIAFTGSSGQAITSALTAYQSSLPGLTINKPSGTLTLPALITERGNWTYTAGTLDVTTNNSNIIFGNSLSISGNGGLNNITFDGSGNYTYNLAGTTLPVSGTMTMSGTGNLILNNGTINLSGNLALTNTATAGTGSTTIAFVNSANQSIVSALAINQCNLPSININKPSGTLTFPALITVRGNWTYSTGTLDVTTNNSTIAYNNTLSFTGSHALNNVNFEGNFNNTYTFNAGTILTVAGTLTTSGSSFVSLSAPVSGTTIVQAQGDVIINNSATLSGGTGAILINGSGNQSLTGNSAAGQGSLPFVKIQKTTGSLNISGTVSVSRDWTYSSGTVNAGSSTIAFGGNNLAISSAGMNFNHLSVIGNTATLSNALALNGNLTIAASAVLAAGANAISVSGNWTDLSATGFNEGTGTVTVNGSASQTVGATGGETFNNLVISSSGAGIKLGSNVTVAGTLTMTQGNIDLNGNIFTLGTSVANPGTLSRSGGTMINSGTVVRWLKANPIASGGVAGLFPVGTSTDYRPLYVAAPVTGPTTGGTIALTYTDANTNSNVSIPDGLFTVLIRKDLNWTLTTGNGLAGGTYEVQTQGTGFGTIGSVSDLRLTQASSAVGAPGTNGGTPSNPQVYRTGLSLANLSNSFFVGSVNPPITTLPIQFVSFTATLNGSTVNLDWVTANQQNVAYFAVERSTTANDWKELQRVPARGGNGLGADYAVEDDNPSSDNLYRIRETDLDGKVKYSEIRQVDIGQSGSITVYPNPATSFVTIHGAGSGKITVSLINAAGQAVTVPYSNLRSAITLSLASLPKGVYFIKVNDEKSIRIRQLVVK